MNNAPQICVSVDVGCRQHSVAIGLPNGEVLDEFDIFHRPEGFKQFFERIEHHCQQHGSEVAVAMEGYNGYARPLDSLVKVRVRWPIAPMANWWRSLANGVDFVPRSIDINYFFPNQKSMMSRTPGMTAMSSATRSFMTN